MRVTDDGNGMDQATIDHIFEPFFTTKPVGKGTGLGLSTVHGILGQMGASISVQSEVDKGTTFTLYFPASLETATADDVPHAPTPLAGRERVLLCEDEAVLRDILCTALEAQGYTVVCAANGREALDIAERLEEGFDVLVTDITTPVMGGKELAMRVRERWPSLRILFTSGHLGEFVVGPQAQFLPKPYPTSVLAENIRALLDSPASDSSPR